LQEGVCSTDSHTPEEEDDGMHRSGKKTSTNDVERSSRIVAPQKLNRLHTPSRVLRRAVVPEVPALPQPRAREVIGQRSPSSSRAVVSMFLLSLGRRRIGARTLIPTAGGEGASWGDQEMVTHGINANPHSP
jgi:hypothetical protein